MRVLVNVARQHFLAGAGLTGDQHRGITARHPRGQLQQLCTGRLERHGPFAIGGADPTLGVPCDQVEQRLGLERLDQVIRRPLAHRIHRALDGTVRRHQQHRQLRLSRPQQSEQLMTIHARHVDVADHQIKRFGRRSFQGFLRRRHGLVIVAGEQQRVCQRLAQRAVVLDQ
ncbi:hypothetical protein D3C76_901390 [compost metagenome]